MECPIARALEEIGDGWSLLILRDALRGVRQFADFQEGLGIAPNTLTRRLDKLCRHGLLRRRRYQEHPPRDEYRLTDKGLELLPILLALGEWGNRWVLHGKASIVPVDLRTGEPIELAIVDRRTGASIQPGAVAVVAGKGASKQLRARLVTPLPLGAESSPIGTQLDSTATRAPRGARDAKRRPA